MAIDQSKKQQITQTIQKKLEEKGRNLVCPICGHNSFILADGYTQDNLQDQLGNFVLGGPSIPTIIVVCNHCGNTIRFSLGILGLMPEDGGKKNDKK